MSFPTESEQQALHERVLQEDPTVQVDVFQAFMDPIIALLVREKDCAMEDAHDSVIEALLSYLEKPARYQKDRGRLSTYLTQAARYQLLSQLRSAATRLRREQKFADVVELQARSPKERMERIVEAKLILEQIGGRLESDQDRAALRLILEGEGSTERLAEVLRLPASSKEELRRTVKRHRDRLMKILVRFGKEDPDDES